VITASPATAQGLKPPIDVKVVNTPTVDVGEPVEAKLENVRQHFSAHFEHLYEAAESQMFSDPQAVPAGMRLVLTHASVYADSALSGVYMTIEPPGGLTRFLGLPNPEASGPPGEFESEVMDVRLEPGTIYTIISYRAVPGTTPLVSIDLYGFYEPVDDTGSVSASRTGSNAKSIHDLVRKNAGP
jgi:hypothetical protein